MERASSHESADQHSPRQIFWRPWFVLSIALLLTCSATFFVARATYNEDRQRFESLLLQTGSTITARLETHIALLRGGAGVLSAHDAQLSGAVARSDDIHAHLVSRAAWRRYVERLRLSAYYPGIQGMGVSVRVPREQKAPFVATARRDYSDFRLWPDPVPPDAGRDYHTILYLEPLDRRNRAAIGYNMFSHSVRRAAMRQAMDSGKATASDKVFLVQEITQEKQAGFLIYLPFYRGGVTPPTVAERREKLLGFVYSPFRAGDFLSNVLVGDSQQLISFQLYDGKRFRPEDLLYQTAASENKPIFTANTTFNAAGHVWGLRVQTRSAFSENTGGYLAPGVLTIGLLMSMLLFAVTWRQAKAQFDAEDAAAELRRSEEQRSRLLDSERAARVQAEEANRAKDEFLATVSHELRTPLTSILGWSHLLTEGKLDDAATRRALETIERNAKAQSQLIEDLLDMSRIISGRLRLELRPLSIVPVLDAALDAVRPAAEIKQIELAHEYEADAGRVSGDPDRLQQIVWNLLANAIKFTPKGGQVKVTLRREGSDVEIAVSDTGIGMDPRFVPHAFDRFRQADASSTRQHGGLGLGLSIVRHLAEMHGGHVRASSGGEGKGSTFMVRLPALEVPAVATAPADAALPHHEFEMPEDAQLQQNLTRLRGARVLIVDDEADSRDIVQAILQMHGARVDTAASASEAMQIFQARRPHLLISDIGMPGEDGYSLLHKIRSLPPEGGGRTPAIALTAFARESDRNAAFAAGFQMHLPKPVAPETLAAAAAMLLGQE